jgi:hypothetical protein
MNGAPGIWVWPKTGALREKRVPGFARNDRQKGKGKYRGAWLRSG